MSINSINLAMSGSSYGAYNQRLTQATKQKLIALNIPFDPNISEQEGKKLLAKAQQTNNNNQQSLSQQNNSSKNFLFEKAKSLAKRLGVEVQEGVEFTQLLNILETKIEEKISANKTNVEALKQLKSLSQELASIQAQSTGSTGYDNTNQALMMSLEMLGAYNRNFLHR